MTKAEAYVAGWRSHQTGEGEPPVDSDIWYAFYSGKLDGEQGGEPEPEDVAIWENIE